MHLKGYACLLGSEQSARKQEERKQSRRGKVKETGGSGVGGAIWMWDKTEKMRVKASSRLLGTLGREYEKLAGE